MALSQTRPIGCACARDAEGHVTTATLCRLHADQDPCLTMSQITGKRRKGSIVRGRCTNCGWTHQRAQTDLTDTLTTALEKGERADFEFYYQGTRWVLSMAPVAG